MTLLEAALDYAARGWPVFPIYEPDGLGWCACKNPECKSPAKHPRTRRGFQNAVTDAGQIERWWRTHPKASIGLATGAVSGLWVLDVDPKDGGTERLAELERQHGPLPATLAATTGSGGRHIFFQHVAGLRITSGKAGGPLGKGLDTRADGGYVVAAPSLHLSGGQYRWDDQRGPGTAPAAIPSWILELENQRIQRAKLEVSKRVEVVARAGARYADFTEAARSYNAANPRDFPRTLGPCPICPSLDGFKAHGRVPGRWACFSSQHIGGGTKRQGHWMGDVLDLDAAQHGRTRKQHLELTGYWGRGVRAEQFAAQRDERLAAVAAPAEAEVFAPHSGALTRSFASLCDILEHPTLLQPVVGGRAIEFNEMSSKVELGRVALQNHHVLDIRRRIELAHCDKDGHGLTYSDIDIWKALDLVARRRTYHPVREYLNALRWDGEPRVELLAEDFLSAPGSPIVRAICKRWMVSCVARALKPGEKVDTALILVGPQGQKKSTFFAALAGADWFADTPMKLGDKDAYLQMRGVWIYEWSELSTIANARDIDQVKGFMSSREDNFRAPYGRGTERVPRSCVFVGSTNRDTFLNDPTGERRFWPIRVLTDDIDLEAVVAARDQLWAEAAELHRAQEQWHLTDPERHQLAELHEDHREVDAWEEPIAVWLESVQALTEPTTTTRILEKAVQKHVSTHVQSDKNRVGRVMRALGFTLRETGGRTARTWAWVKTTVRTTPYDLDPSRTHGFPNVF